MTLENNKSRIEQVRFPSFGSYIMLEGEYTEHGREYPRCGVIICHPHPLYGGNMHNIIISKLRDSFVELGTGTLRFNFRGTGLSEGEHDNGNAEVYDIIGASRYLIDRGIPTVRQAVIGYSFGAAMAVKFLENNPNPVCFVGIALPTAFPEYFRSELDIKLPALLISGDQDEISSLKEAVNLVSFRKVETLSFEGGNHLFTGTVPGEKRSRISALVARTTEFITHHLDQLDK